MVVCCLMKTLPVLNPCMQPCQIRSHHRPCGDARSLEPLRKQMKGLIDLESRGTRKSFFRRPPMCCQIDALFTFDTCLSLSRDHVHVRTIREQQELPVVYKVQLVLGTAFIMVYDCPNVNTVIWSDCLNSGNSSVSNIAMIAC